MQVSFLPTFLLLLFCQVWIIIFFTLSLEWRGKAKKINQSPEHRKIDTPSPLPLPLGERMKVRGKTPRLLTQTPLCKRGMKNKSHHIERDKTAPSHRKRRMKERGVKSDG